MIIGGAAWVWIWALRLAWVQESQLELQSVKQWGSPLEKELELIEPKI